MRGGSGPDAGGVPEPLARLRVAARADRLKTVRALVAETTATAGFGPEAVQELVLAVDEACQNIIRHTYGDGATGDMVLEIQRRRDGLLFWLRDYGPVVDPDQVVSRDLDDLRPGGLGSHFIRTIMDDVQFFRPDDGPGNLLRLFKRWRGG